MEYHPSWYSSRCHSWHAFPHSSSSFNPSENPIDFICNMSVDFIHFFPSLLLPPSPPLSLSLTNAIASQYWSSLPLSHISYKLVIIHQPEYSSNTNQIMWLARNSSVIYVFCSYNKIHFFFFQNHSPHGHVWSGACSPLQLHRGLSLHWVPATLSPFLFLE